MRWLDLARLLPGLTRLRAEMGVKGWYSSKTFWFNAITLAAAGATIVWGAQANLTDAEAMAIAIVLSSAVNGALRVVTLRPVWSRGVADSKTLWVNTVSAVAAALVAVYGADAAIPDAELAGIALALHAVANIGLRLVTRQPVGLRSVPPTPAEPGAGHDDRGPQSSPDLV
jgi:hypothetical protein